jgi:hypothetical protein
MCKEKYFIDSLLDLHYRYQSDLSIKIKFEDALEECLIKGYIYKKEVGNNVVYYCSKTDKEIFLKTFS